VDKQALTWRFFADESGATAIEYALIGGIMLTVVVAIAATGGALTGVYDRVSEIVGALGGGGGGDGSTPSP
jgi:Flp pilus assembly pilin Flp